MHREKIKKNVFQHKGPSRHYSHESWVCIWNHKRVSILIFTLLSHDTTEQGTEGLAGSGSHGGRRLLL
jgi:hypothetical protein